MAKASGTLHHTEKENPKYTLLLVNVLDFWAKMCGIEGYPKDLEPVGESVMKIKKFFGVG